ncbi:MAG: ribonuclease HI [Epsilonproteobacteria bacterium]|nr:ribonuclease HI [Campylobacterota bacterium]
MKQVHLYSDGSSLGNPGYGGYCAILKYGDHEKVISGGQVDATNNQMELKAVIEGLRVLKEPCFVNITSDSSYVVNGINEWLDGWVKKAFKKVKNPDLWGEYIEVSKAHQVKAYWVKGHAGHEENERCDDIARGEAEKLQAEGR